ncbi:hypothetical protein E2562_033151 [Oryza meyeriana var. granulata]|uniref:Uncharacterized protein n=1 Tax=Oryza meyeriana var. granulata TaxID=110450 RepID=A0A6G1DTN7_9ORYZ|nr:hypothetical protein E2562_033151 [Oryza meyeriana var. granulata]
MVSPSVAHQPISSFADSAPSHTRCASLDADDTNFPIPRSATEQSQRWNLTLFLIYGYSGGLGGFGRGDAEAEMEELMDLERLA